MKLELKHLQLVGPIVFLIVGVGFAIAGAIAPAGAFFFVMGAVFGGAGVLWLAGAIAFLRYLDRRDSGRAHLMQHGILVRARVISCESTGYSDFSGRVWTNLTFELEANGAPPVVHTKHVALSHATLELARAGGPIPVYVDPSDPTRFVFG